MDAMVYPFSERGKPGIETLLVDPDAGANAQHSEILGAVAQIVSGTGGDGQQLSNLLYPVDKGFEPGCLRSGLRFRGRGLGHFYCTGFGDIVQGFGGGRIAGLKVFQKHLLFRSTAWLMGATDLQSPKCGMREAGPALRQDWPLNFSARNTEIRAPAALPPRTCPSGRVHGQAERILEKRIERNKTEMRFIFADPGGRARGAGNFYFPPEFYSRAQSG